MNIDQACGDDHMMTLCQAGGFWTWSLHLGGEGTKCHLFENVENKIAMKGYGNRIFGPDDNKRNLKGWEA